MLTRRACGWAVAAWLALTALGARPAEAAEGEATFTATDVGNDTLVLQRPRQYGGGTEGFVVDSKLLVETLKRRVLEARGLGEVAELSESSPSSSGSSSSREGGATGSTPYVFSHRFGPPFQSLEATLRLAPLAEPDEGSLVYPLTALLAACAWLGLYALYRMTATQLEFAERRSNFVSAVSHELKTPLTAIRMYGEMLQEDLVEDEAKRREYYRTITAESERLTRLINNVLELANVQRRTLAPVLKAGDVLPVVREVLAVLEPHAAREGSVLELEVEHVLPPVLFDDDALKQVLFNLIDNALKYGREAPDKRITLRCEVVDRHVRLSVRDRGPGVQEDQLEAVFEPFFRGERELTRKNQGCGMGLALVKGLVERMKGRVRGHNAEPGFEVQIELEMA